MKTREYRCLDVDNQPVISHANFEYTDGIYRLQPRRKNGCLGVVENTASFYASYDDAEWFAKNLHETFRVRPYRCGEFGYTQVGERFLPVVFVIKVGLGQRIRIGIAEFVGAGVGGEG